MRQIVAGGAPATAPEAGALPSTTTNCDVVERVPTGFMDTGSEKFEFTVWLCYDSPMLRRKAIGYLLLATAFWGLSFPITKAFGLLQEQLLPSSSSWFRSASIITVRFCLATAAMLIWSLPKLGHLTRLEIYQGLGLGLFGGAGLLFQMDGLIYTSASNSGFITGR